MASAGPRVEGTTTVWISCEAIVPATTRSRCPPSHVTTPGRMASATVVWASEEREPVS